MKKSDVTEFLFFALGGALVWLIIGIVFGLSAGI